MKVYRIYDWAGNPQFGDERFDSLESGSRRIGQYLETLLPEDHELEDTVRGYYVGLEEGSDD